MRLFSLVAVTALLTLSLAGCGQKGPLYLPQPSEAEQPADPSPASQP